MNAIVIGHIQRAGQCSNSCRAAMSARVVAWHARRSDRELLRGYGGSGDARTWCWGAVIGRAHVGDAVRGLGADGCIGATASLASVARVVQLQIYCEQHNWAASWERERARIGRVCRSGRVCCRHSWSLEQACAGLPESQPGMADLRVRRCRSPLRWARRVSRNPDDSALRQPQRPPQRPCNKRILDDSPPCATITPP